VECSLVALAILDTSFRNVVPVKDLLDKTVAILCAGADHVSGSVN
jgi:hypothetical protein